MTAEPAAPGPDTGPYEVIHLGGQAAVVVPVADFLRLRALERAASPRSSRTPRTPRSGGVGAAVLGCGERDGRVLAAGPGRGRDRDHRGGQAGDFVGVFLEVPPCPGRDRGGFGELEGAQPLGLGPPDPVAVRGPGGSSARSSGLGVRWPPGPAAARKPGRRTAR
jgi:hypothetical protein